MAKHQISVTRTGLDEILQHARQVYGYEMSDSELIRRMLFDWHTNRQSDSKSAALKRIESVLAELKEQGHIETLTILKEILAIREALNNAPTPDSDTPDS